MADKHFRLLGLFRYIFGHLDNGWFLVDALCFCSSYVYVVGKLVLMYVGVIFFLYCPQAKKHLLATRAFVTVGETDIRTFILGHFLRFFICGEWTTNDRRLLLGSPLGSYTMSDREKIGKNSDFIAHIFTSLSPTNFYLPIFFYTWTFKFVKFS